MNTIRIDNFDFVVRNIQQIQTYYYLNNLYEDEEFINSKKYMF